MMSTDGLFECAIEENTIGLSLRSVFSSSKYSWDSFPYDNKSGNTNICVERLSESPENLDDIFDLVLRCADE
ncbi:hypothetical protein TNIN_424981 [Trichonephila inaurata madagascariensis]|uniref:Uncharacterized protein n=1 Tax=Trichonephila inaurata madagascariensis TaxID=2747483 RepID=A0A8X6WZT7_9ARAC|nr:hypothetical protein TNIN_424981 [Trichonephila inaurata madagascariensis]